MTLAIDQFVDTLRVNPSVPVFRLQPDAAPQGEFVAFDIARAQQ
jgi:hypothetical protein